MSVASAAAAAASSSSSSNNTNPTNEAPKDDVSSALEQPKPSLAEQVASLHQTQARQSSMTAFVVKSSSGKGASKKAKPRTKTNGPVKETGKQGKLVLAKTAKDAPQVAKVTHKRKREEKEEKVVVLLDEDDDDEDGDVVMVEKEETVAVPKVKKAKKASVGREQEEEVELPPPAAPAAAPVEPKQARKRKAAEASPSSSASSSAASSSSPKKAKKAKKDSKEKKEKAPQPPKEKPPTLPPQILAKLPALRQSLEEELSKALPRADFFSVSVEGVQGDDNDEDETHGCPELPELLRKFQEEVLTPAGATPLSEFPVLHLPLLVAVTNGLTAPLPQVIATVRERLCHSMPESTHALLPDKLLGDVLLTVCERVWYGEAPARGAAATLDDNPRALWVWEACSHNNIPKGGRAVFLSLRKVRRTEKRVITALRKFIALLEKAARGDYTRTKSRKSKGESSSAAAAAAASATSSVTLEDKIAEMVPRAKACEAALKKARGELKQTLAKEQMRKAKAMQKIMTERLKKERARKAAEEKAKAQAAKEAKKQEREAKQAAKKAAKEAEENRKKASQRKQAKLMSSFFGTKLPTPTKAKAPVAEGPEEAAAASSSPDKNSAVILAKRSKERKFFSSGGSSSSSGSNKSGPTPFLNNEFYVHKHGKVAPVRPIAKIDSAVIDEALGSGVQDVRSDAVQWLRRSREERLDQRAARRRAREERRKYRLAHPKEEADDSDSDGDVELVVQHKKLLQFHDTIRPPFYGVVERSRSEQVSARRPFVRDAQIDYDVDTEDEWEEDDGGDEAIVVTETGEEVVGADDDDEEEEEDNETGGSGLREDGLEEDGWLIAEDDAECHYRSESIADTAEGDALVAEWAGPFMHAASFPLSKSLHKTVPAVLEADVKPGQAQLPVSQPGSTLVPLMGYFSMVLLAPPGTTLGWQDTIPPLPESETALAAKAAAAAEAEAAKAQSWSTPSRPATLPNGAVLETTPESGSSSSSSAAAKRKPSPSSKKSKLPAAPVVKRVTGGVQTSITSMLKSVDS